MGLNYYSVLDVPRSASVAEIKKAYRKQALKWHPDRHPNEKKLAEEKFKEIHKAYEILSNPLSKAYYDEVFNWRTTNRQPSNGHSSSNDYAQYKANVSKEGASRKDSWVFWVILIGLGIVGSLNNSSKNDAYTSVSSKPNPVQVNSIAPETQNYSTGQTTNKVQIETPSPTQVLGVSSEPVIDCTGPDGKHLSVTQKECDDFNNAWAPTPIPRSTQDTFSSFSFSTSCSPSCGNNSYCSYGVCLCNDGYTKNYSTGNCDPCPSNSTGQYGTCVCNQGYTKNYTTGQCDVLNCPPNASESYGSCICNNGYIKNYSTGNCDACPPNSTWQYGSCLCNSGYTKDYSTGQCNKI